MKMSSKYLNYNELLESHFKVNSDKHNVLPTFSAPAGGKLSPDMIAAYNEAGVLILENFVSAGECGRLRERARILIDEFDPTKVRSVFSAKEQTQLNDRYFYESGDKIRFFLEYDAFDESGNLIQPKEDCLNKMGHAMHDLDPVFREFSYRPELGEITRGLGIANPGLLQSMYIFKPPRIGGEVHFHQDSTFIYTEPESCTGFWFALEDATIENGCMYFIPGQHRGPLKQRNYRVDENSFTIETLDDSPWPEELKLPAEAATGTMVMFDGRSPHMSYHNTSDKSRHAYTLHVIDQNCHYPADNWLQRGPDLPLRGFPQAG
jgi:phytanoyl-CoA hydroxylase